MLFWKNCIYLWQLSSNATFVSIWLCWTHIHTFHGRFPVWSSLYRYYSIATCKNKPVVSRVHSQGICQNRFLYLLERSSEAPVTLFLGEEFYQEWRDKRQWYAMPWWYVCGDYEFLLSTLLELLTGTACFCGHGSHVMVQPFPVEVLALSLILSVPFSGVWRLAKIYFCSVAGMIIRWAFVTTPFSVAIWSQKGQHGFKSVGTCLMCKPTFADQFF